MTDLLFTNPPEPVKRAIEVIRKYVGKPITLPSPIREFALSRLRWGRRCPLGLLPGAASYTPCYAETINYLDGLNEEDVTHFITWWDDQEDAKKAVEAVWGNA